MTALTEAALLREVAVLQRDKTLLAVRDAMASIPLTRMGDRYATENRSAKEFSQELMARLARLQEES